MSQFPVRTVPPAQRAAIEALVRKLLDAEGQGPQVAEWERELNVLVYEVYGLTGGGDWGGGGAESLNALRKMRALKSGSQWPQRFQ